MVDLLAFSAILLIIIALFSIVFLILFLVTNYHPIFVEMKHILEQANIDNQGELTVSQVEYLSHLASNSIVCNLDAYILSIVIFIMAAIVLLNCSPKFFKLFLYFFIFCEIWSMGVYYLNWKKNQSTNYSSTVLNNFPSEEYFLKMMEIHKDNPNIKKQARHFRDLIKPEDVQRFFEDQKI